MPRLMCWSRSPARGSFCGLERSGGRIASTLRRMSFTVGGSYQWTTRTFVQASERLSPTFSEVFRDSRFKRGTPPENAWSAFDIHIHDPLCLPTTEPPVAKFSGWFLIPVRLPGPPIPTLPSPACPCLSFPVWEVKKQKRHHVLGGIRTRNWAKSARDSLS